MDWHLLLKRARERMPSVVHERERFEIPKARVHFEGRKTIIENFIQIAAKLRRASEHLQKFLFRELATPGELTPAGLVLGSPVLEEKINEKIKSYALEFVLCQDCGKPDTEIKKEGELQFIKCSACGAKHIVRML